MRKYLAALLLVLAAAAQAQVGPLPGMGTSLISSNTVTFNMVTDFGAACNGVANDDPAFVAAHTAMKADRRVVAGADVTLIIPPGSTCRFTSCTGSYFGQLNNFTLVMTGATFTGFNGCFNWANGNIDVSQQNPIATSSAGASCVTMLNAGTEAGYHPGRWVLLGGMGLQGNSYPPNFGLFEYLQVASEGSGQVCFTTPLVNSYKSTWTDLDTTCAGAFHCGSNPFLFLMDLNWGKYTYKMVGGTITWDSPWQFVSGNVEFDDVTWVITNPGSVDCYVPTFARLITFNHVTMGPNCTIEADKEVENWVINNSTISSAILFQSSSFKALTLNNSTVAFLDGTASNTFCNNSTIGSNPTGAAMWFGNSYGNALSFTGTNCHFNGAIRDNYANPGANFQRTAVSYYYTYSGSGLVQVIAASDGGPGFSQLSPPQWWVPGTVMTFGGERRNEGFQFTVTDNSCIVRGGAPPCIGGQLTVNTTIPGAFPPVVPDPTFGPYIVPDLMRDWACSNCDGTPEAVDLSQAPAQHQPLWTYSSRTYTCTNNLPNVPGASDLNHAYEYGLLGNMVSVTIDVSRADTGPNGSLVMGTDQFGRLPITNQVTGVNGVWGYGTNLKIAGTRVITPTAVTGAQSGDTGTFPGANTWIGSDPGTSGGNGIFTNHDLTAEPAAQCPVVTLTFVATR